LFATSANAINATLYQKLNFDFVRDSSPIASIIDSPLVMGVNPAFAAKTVSEFIAYARANPGMSMASGGVGSPNHIAGELFKMMTGVDMVHVPYRGDAPAIADLIAGQVQIYFGTLGGIDRVYQGRKTARASHHHGHALRGTSEHYDIR
jgi:tripartite-type tricarboxylate transporter receptor subunit TctC